MQKTEPIPDHLMPQVAAMSTSMTHFQFTTDNIKGQ